MSDGAGPLSGGPTLRRRVSVIDTREKLADLVARYSQQDSFAFDVETQGEERLIPVKNDVAWISLATQGHADVIPMGHRNGSLVGYKAPVLKSGLARLASGQELRASDVSRSESRRVPEFSEPPDQLSRTEVFAALRPLFFSERTKVCHNVGFDVGSCAKYLGGIMPGPFADTAVADAILDSRLKGDQLRLADCLRRRLGYDMAKGVGKDITLHSFEDVATYSLLDSKFTWLLWVQQQKILEDRGLSRVMDLEMDVLEVLIHMEAKGTLIDVDALMSFRDELDRELVRARADAYRAAGRKFNVNSTQEKVDLLFGPDGQGLKPVELTPTGQPSTSESALKPHRRNPLVKSLSELSTLGKLQSTYVIPYLGGEVERTTAGTSRTVKRTSMLVDGRIHTTFRQVGTETGRMSSANPNLQNIPSRGETGKRLRNMFVADPGHVLVVADYSQVEPRIIASLTGDEKMVAAYRDGLDLYQQVADQLSVTRPVGKELVLSMAYGIGPDAISERIGMSVTKSRSLLEQFSRQYPAVDRYKAKVINEARLRRPEPYVRTVVGRVRPIPELLSPNREKQASGRRRAFNTVIQGSAADIMKIALVRAHMLIPEGASILLTVHDELVVQCPEELAEETSKAVVEAMEGVAIPSITVPLVAECGTGRSWADAK